jgi:hypothetical protein
MPIKDSRVANVSAIKDQKRERAIGLRSRCYPALAKSCTSFWKLPSCGVTHCFKTPHHYHRQKDCRCCSRKPEPNRLIVSNSRLPRSFLFFSLLLFYVYKQVSVLVGTSEVCRPELSYVHQNVYIFNSRNSSLCQFTLKPSSKYEQPRD